jgi:hypothetical protein
MRADVVEVANLPLSEWREAFESGFDNGGVHPCLPVMGAPILPAGLRRFKYGGNCLSAMDLAETM